VPGLTATVFISVTALYVHAAMTEEQTDKKKENLAPAAEQKGAWT
jgi:hypothetical protein